MLADQNFVIAADDGHLVVVVVVVAITAVGVVIYFPCLFCVQVLADQHNDLKSLVAAITKGLNTANSKAQALYCWLTSQKPELFKDSNKKTNSPSGRLKQLYDKKTSHAAVYMDMLK